jgi:hypothetical protein
MNPMDYLAQAKESIFRFEYLREYKVPSEWDSFTRYQDTGILDTSFLREWWSFLEGLHAKEIITQRVRLVREPKTEYTKWELQVHQQTLSHGDDIRIISQDKLTPVLELLKDFWLIDFTTALSMVYSDAGEYLGFTVHNNAEEYSVAKKYLLDNSKSLL